MTIVAGKLVWDLDIARQQEAMAKVEAFGKELDKALNKPRQNTGIEKAGEAAQATAASIARLTQQFTELQSRYRLGQVGADEYRQRLDLLAKGLSLTANHSGLAARDLKALADTTGKVSAEQAKFTAEQDRATAAAGRTQAASERIRASAERALEAETRQHAAAAQRQAAADARQQQAAERQSTAAAAQARAAYEAAQAQAFASDTANTASERVQRLAERYRLLKGQFDANAISSTEYARRLQQLEQGIIRTTRQVGLSSRDWTTLGTTMRSVQQQHATLGGATADVVQKVRVLTSEVFALRTRWDHTGQATTETKNRLRELSEEAIKLSDTIRGMDGGFERFNLQIRQVEAAGRTAEATLAGMEGRMSRLGLASQVNLAATQALQSQFYRYGPAGMAASHALGITAGGMSAVSVGTLAAGAGIAAVAGIAYSLTQRGIPEVREFQQALRIMIADGAELSQSQLADELERVREAAGRAGNLFTRADMATAVSELVKAGLDTRDAFELMAPAMQLAAITGDNLNDTSSRLLANLRQFRLPVTEAARAADALAMADLAAAEGAKELSEGMSIVGPVARAAGLSFEDTLGILVELNNAGLAAASVGATALRSNLSQLLSPTAQSKAVLAGLGVELRDTAGRARPLLTVLRELLAAMEGNSEAAQIAADIFDTRALVAILNMTEASDELADSLRNSAGAAERFVDVIAEENYAFAMNELAAAGADLAAAFAGTFADDIAGAARALAEFFRNIDRFKDGGGIEILRGIFNIIRSPFQPIPLDERFLPSPLSSGGRGFSDGGPDIGDEFRWWVPPGAMQGPAQRPYAEIDNAILDTTVSMAALIAEARRLKTALDAATDPQDWIAANAAVDAFKDSSDEAAQAWAAVVATMRGGGRATARDRTPGDVLTDLSERMRVLGTRSEAFGSTLESQTTMLQGQVSAIDQAINGLIDLEVDAADARIQNLIEHQQRLREQLAELTTPQAAAQTWVTRLRTELQLGLRSAADVFDIINPRVVELREEVAQAFSEFGIDSRQYQDAVAKLNVLESLWKDVATEAQAVTRAPLIRAEALDADLRAEQEEVARLQAEIDARRAGADPRAGNQIGLTPIFRQLDADLTIIERTAVQMRALGLEYDELQARQESYNRAFTALINSGANEANIAGTRETLAGLNAELTQRQTLRDAIEAAAEWDRAWFAERAELEHQQALLTRDAERRERERAAQLQRDIVAAGVFRAEVLDQALRDEQAAVAETQARFDRERVARESQIQRVQASVLAALDSGDTRLLRGALQSVEVFRTRFGEAWAEQFANVEVLLDRQLSYLEGRLARLMANPTRLARMGSAEVEGPSAGMASSLTPAQIRERLGLVQAGDDIERLKDRLKLLRAELGDSSETVRELERQINRLEAAEKLASLQEHLSILRDAGVLPTAASVRELVTEIERLQVAAAMEELLEEGTEGLSEFNREVLIAAGILPGAVLSTNALAKALRGMTGNDVAQGLADILDGIDKIKKAGGDTEEVIAGLTMVLEGAAKAIESLTDGSTFDRIKSIAMVVGEIAGRMAGIPGLGPLVGAVFDVGAAIYTAIKDAVTGDSPAARAIREGLTPTIASAFTEGILQGVRGAKGWQEDLRESVKLVFLRSLIDAFVQGAIIQTYLQPIINEYSKMLARGQTEAAAQFIASALPSALNQAVAAAEQFVGSIPPWLVPTGDSSDPGGGQTGVFDLPTAAVSNIAAPTWALDLVNAAHIQRQASLDFAEAVRSLREEGITVAVSGSRGPSGFAAAERAI